MIAARFRVIGEPMRIALPDRLREGPATVKQLTGVLGSSQQNVSGHPNVLCQAGLVSRAKARTAVRYVIADESVVALCELICGGLCEQLAELEKTLAGGGTSGRRALRLTCEPSGQSG